MHPYQNTFEKVGFLFAKVTWCWYGKRGINAVWYALKADWNVPRIVPIQDIIVKPPVLVPLKQKKYKAQNGDATTLALRIQRRSVRNADPFMYVNNAKIMHL